MIFDKVYINYLSGETKTIAVPKGEAVLSWIIRDYRTPALLGLVEVHLKVYSRSGVTYGKEHSSTYKFNPLKESMWELL